MPTILLAKNTYEKREYNHTNCTIILPPNTKVDLNGCRVGIKIKVS